MSDFAQQRRMMVDCQLRTYDVTDPGVTAAMDTVPREAFVSDSTLAYLDRSVPMLPGSDRQLMTPMVFARLIQAAEIVAGSKVLVVGAGTGYGAAVIADMGAVVTALECDPALQQVAAERLAGSPVVLAKGPLEEGDKARAPYDVIVVEGAFEVEPDALLAQLADGGRLVGVKGSGRAASATVYRKSGKTVGNRTITEAAAPILPGFAKRPAFVF
ncbi:protein-L-isoaspartate O-methyltransferase [uncultured Alsobacter sp.]|uniref:protein-L-isoaspartate O-methyltransferase family protein n=1 Tax=uncultured Alsobacter sp. TaxID=1748258 RepID=UPI0025FF5A61|nr:protein-L-isoaspartate O-methyltransferase [uncultured Alsobacter sp.]